MTDATLGKYVFGKSDAGRGGAADDPGLVERLYRRHWAELCRYVRRKFGAGPPDPEEVVQTAFARFAALDHPEAVTNPRAFLYQCARNVAIDQKRKDSVRSKIDADISIFDHDDGAAIPDAERVISGRERLRIVDAAVRAMSPQRRRVLIMHAIHGQGYSEIARGMGLSPTRVTQLFASAVAECARAVRDAEAVQPEDRQ